MPIPSLSPRSPKLKFRLPKYGFPAGLMSHFRNIAKRRETEDALRRSEENLNAAQRIAHIGSWEWDILHDTASWSEETYHIFGVNPDFLKDHRRSFLDFIHTDDRAIVDQALSDAIQGIHEYDLNYRIIRSDGVGRVIHARAEVVRSDDGRAIFMRGTVHDITERKQREEEQRKLEEQLQQMRKIEAIGQLAGGVAHDLNNMLTPVLGYGEMLLSEIPEQEKYHSEIHQMVQAAERARDLVQQLLAFAHKQTIDLKPLDLNRVICDFKKFLRRTIREDVEIRIHAEPGLGGIMGDPRRIEQVILNLVINAQDAMPTGGKLDIEMANVELDKVQAMGLAGIAPGSYVMMCVTDNGIGMDESTLQRIFEPFFTTKEPNKGTGMGLATVYGIVHQHGGAVRAFSAPGKGARFEIFFPRVMLPDKRSAKQEPTPVVQGTETILVVEDQDQVRGMICSMLKRQGYALLLASSGEEAIEVAARHQGIIHLLLTDVVMTGMDGRQLHKQLIVGRPGIKVLFMSGYAKNVISHHGVLDEGLSFIEKPFTIATLSKFIREVLDS